MTAGDNSVARLGGAMFPRVPRARASLTSFPQVKSYLIVSIQLTKMLTSDFSSSMIPIAMYPVTLS